MITKMKDPYILCWGIQISIDRTLHICWDIQIPVEKAVQYPNEFKHDRTLHPILCGDIQIPTEKCSSVLK